MKRDQLPNHIRDKCPDGLSHEQVEAWLLGYLANNPEPSKDDTQDNTPDAAPPIITPTQSPATPQEHATNSVDALPADQPEEAESGGVRTRTIPEALSHKGSTIGFVLSFLLLLAFLGKSSKIIQGQEYIGDSPVWSLIASLIIFLGSSAYRCMKVRILLGKKGGRLIYEGIAVLGLFSVLGFIISFPAIHDAQPTRVVLSTIWCIAAYIIGITKFKKKNTIKENSRDPWKGQRDRATPLVAKHSQSFVSEDSWCCPECKHINPNTTFKCEYSGCNFRIV